MPRRSKRVKPKDQHADFVISFVDDSREARRDFEEIWEEVELNYLVRPLQDASLGSITAYPLIGSRSELQNNYRNRGVTILKDPETHQSVMTIASKIVLGLMGEPDFIKAKKVGTEDLFAAQTVSKLLQHALGMEGHFWAFIEWIVGTCIYGTGILEAGWEYVEKPREFRSLTVDPTTGEERSETTTLLVPVYDDPKFSTISVRDFFPDTSGNLIHNMQGCAKRIKLTRMQLEDMADRDIYDKESVARALDDGPSSTADDHMDHPETDETVGTGIKKKHPDFEEVTGYEYFGTVPFRTRDGISHRVVTEFNGVTVRSRPWPRRIPFFECKLTPRLGSFWGVSPAEVMRYDQDFADTLKMMLADAVVRSVHPPHIYDRNADVDLAKLRRFSPDVPIGANRSDAIQQVKYDPPVAPAFNMYAGVKQQMREGGGALGAIQGLGLGSKRFSATEAAQTFEQALDRPELWASIIEREFLPALGKYTLGLYQSFLEEGTDDVQLRIGQSELPVELSTILGDFDIEFVGSRLEGGKAQKIAAFREIAAASANPIIAQTVPWIPLLRKWFDELGAHEIAAMVGNPQLMQLNILLNTIGGQNALGGNGNGTTPAREPVGALPAQLAGGLQ